jgi:hypothetical protein
LERAEFIEFMEWNTIMVRPSWRSQLGPGFMRCEVDLTFRDLIGSAESIGEWMQGDTCGNDRLDIRWQALSAASYGDPQAAHADGWRMVRGVPIISHPSFARPI